jgi:uncharacterized repeat protein (TIGR01451 family)
LLVTIKLPPALKHPAGAAVEAELPLVKAGETKVLDLSTTAERSGPQIIEADAATTAGERVLARCELAIKAVSALRLKKSGPFRLIRGQKVEYQLEVTNVGDAAAANVLLTDQLPKGLKLVEASNKGSYDPSLLTVNWLLGTIHPGETYVVGVRIRGEAQGPTAVTNAVTAQAIGGVQARLNPTLLIEEPGAPNNQRPPGGSGQ